MDIVFSFDSPPLHAFVVNFPIALLSLAVFTALVWAANGSRFWRRATLLLTGFGAAFSLAGMFTGRVLREQVAVRPVVSALIDYYESFALYTAVASVIATLVLGGLSFYLERRTTIQRNPPDPGWIRTLGFLLVVVAAAFCAITAHMGATMVWTR